MLGRDTASTSRMLLSPAYQGIRTYIKPILTPKLKRTMNLSHATPQKLNETDKKDDSKEHPGQRLVGCTRGGVEARKLRTDGRRGELNNGRERVLGQADVIQRHGRLDSPQSSRERKRRRREGEGTKGGEGILAARSWSQKSFLGARPAPLASRLPRMEQDAAAAWGAIGMVRSGFDWSKACSPGFLRRRPVEDQKPAKQSDKGGTTVGGWVGRKEKGEGMERGGARRTP